MTTTGATRTKLEPGQHSIDRVVPKMKDGKHYLKWRLCLWSGVVATFETTGNTKAEMYRRARQKATDKLATSTSGLWSPASKLSDYIEKVSLPAVEAANLEPNTEARYRIVLRQLVGDCRLQKHRHQDSLRDHTIGTGTRFRTLEACLKEIAKLHGAESARQARTVLGRYVIQQLIRDEILTGNPLAGMAIDLRAPKRVERYDGPPLTLDEYQRTVAHLLELDPAEGVSRPKRGRWSLDDAVAKRRNVIDLTLLQSATGLRVGEANEATWDDLEVDDNGDGHVVVDRTKTDRGRRIPILNPDVLAHLQSRRERGGHYILGSPADASKVWLRDNCRKECAAFYQELAGHLKIAAFEKGRTHLWRETLNTLLLADVPEVVRAAYFGHDVKVNRQFYTDTTDTSGMIAAAKRLF